MKLKSFLVLCYTFLKCFFLSAQNDSALYKFSLGKEASITAVSACMLTSSFIVKKTVTPFSICEIPCLKTNQVNSFDRAATNQWNTKANTASDVLAIGSFALPATLLIGKQPRKDWLRIGALTAETYLVSTAITTLTKATVHRTRPYLYNTSVSDEEKLSVDGRMSFFSGHTASTASACFLTARLYADYYPKSKYRYAVWAGAATIPAVTGYFRYKAGKHFPSDIITGYAVGALVGYFMPQIHKSKKQTKLKPNFNP